MSKRVEYYTIMCLGPKNSQSMYPGPSKGYYAQLGTPPGSRRFKTEWSFSYRPVILTKEDVKKLKGLLKRDKPGLIFRILPIVIPSAETFEA